MAFGHKQTCRFARPTACLLTAGARPTATNGRYWTKPARSDADSDIGLALLWAARRWTAPEYQQAALTVVQSLWDKTVVVINGKPYLTAGDWSPAQTRPSLNPSYQSPYSYRLFATLDPGHNWQGVVDTAYEVVNGCATAQLNNETGVKLPPNWCGIDKQTGQFRAGSGLPEARYKLWL